MRDKQTVIDVPGQIFEKFLEEMKASEISAEIIERLRSTVFEQRNINEEAIKLAIFPNTPES